MLVPSFRVPSAGHVGHLGRGHQQHPGPRTRRHRAIGHLADQLRRGARRQRPAHLEPQLRQAPHRVMPLHLRHRGPRRHRLQVLADRDHRARSERRDIGVHPGERGDLPRRGLRLPRRQPFRLAGVPAAAVDLAGRRLRPPRHRRRLLVHQPPRPLRRRVPVLALIRRRHLLHLGRQRRRPRGEQVHDLLGHPADLAPVPVRPGHHGVPPGEQPPLHLPVHLRRDRQPLVMQRPSVQPPELAHPRRPPAAPGSRSRCARAAADPRPG